MMLVGEMASLPTPAAGSLVNILDMSVPINTRNKFPLEKQPKQGKYLDNPRSRGKGQLLPHLCIPASSNPH